MTSSAGAGALLSRTNRAPTSVSGLCRVLEHLAAGANELGINFRKRALEPA